MKNGKTAKEEVQIFDATVNFKDKSHLDIKDIVENGEKLNELLVRDD